MQIRPATRKDAETIALFNCRLAEETEGVRLNPDTVEQGVFAALEADLGATYWLAEIDGRVVGQLMTTREWSDWHNCWYVWLQSVYVDAEFRGRGIFRALSNHVQQNAAASGDVHSIRLYVEAENHAAQETYSRLGFTSSGYHVLHRILEKTEEIS